MTKDVTDIPYSEPDLKNTFENCVFTDRYQIFGIPYPDPKTMCKGPCEGMGFFPQHGNDMDEYHSLWLEAEKNARRTRRYWWDRFVRALQGKPRDLYHFIKCPHCNGTGKEFK